MTTKPNEVPDPFEGMTRAEIVSAIHDVSVDEADKFLSMRETQEAIDLCYLNMVFDVWIIPRIEACDYTWLRNDGVALLLSCGFPDAQRIIEGYIERELSSG